ncbi:hypothetical protein ACQPZZ_26915 [Microbispora sp. CA-135349]|uniref:hypothetical protein n=1 Tax=Microbispora sp. CA-135349 TaxID=3239953 RepID=UPI003D915E93
MTRTFPGRRIILALGLALFGTVIPHAAAAAAGAVTRVVVIAGDDTYVPPWGTETHGLEVVVSNPYAEESLPAVKIEYRKAGESETAGWREMTIPATGQVQPLPAGAELPSQANVRGTFPISSTDPVGEWPYRITLMRGGSTLDVKTGALKIGEGPSVTMTVDPQNVVLRRHVKVPANVVAKIEQVGSVTDARVESVRHGDVHRLSTAVGEDGYLRDEVGFDDASATGAWRLTIIVQRGGNSYTFARGFAVSRAAKQTSKVVLHAPSRVARGRLMMLTGTVYRGDIPWAGKVVEIFFRKKGTHRWTLVDIARTTSSGRYAEVVRPKYDGHWYVTVSGTGKIEGSTSGYKYVDVR